MEETLPAAAAPDENAAPEETAREVDQPAREGKRFRVPSSVVLTLVVALLSVWVAPAFARQWDERQKARELQAALAQEVAVATTAAIGDGLAALTGAESLDPMAAAKEWDTARARLEAELRAYYPEDDMIERWYQTSMDIADLQRLAPACHELFVMAGFDQPRELFQEPLAREFLIDLLYERPASRNDKLPSGTWERAEKRGDNYARWVFSAREKGLDPVRFLAKLLRRMFALRVDATLAQILETTPDDFSTTRRDLLRDLLP